MPQSAAGGNRVSRRKVSLQTTERGAGPPSDADRDLMMLLADGLPPAAIARCVKISSKALARRKADIRKRLTMSSQCEGGYVFEILRRMLGAGSETLAARRSQHAGPKTIELTRSAAKEMRAVRASLFGPITEALAELADDVHRGIPLQGQCEGL